ncbi:MAG TPA: VOC family protein [Acidobacteriaceae bacterium]|jgi:lactoylglutathione lyase|nr:VOC family protein [Acidobacteriaceae bacterium]
MQSVPAAAPGNVARVSRQQPRTPFALRAVAWGAAVAALILTGVSPAAASDAQSSTPHITGMAHMAYYVSDLKKARDYYEKWLGFQEAFALRNADGSDGVVYIKINDHQYIELYAEAPKNHGFIHDAGFETNDAKGMRDHLASVGVKVPDIVTKDDAGNLSFEITDPSGFTIQIVQYLPGSMTSKTNGKLMPAARISDHIDHIGLLVNDRETSWKFYGDAFGFTKDGDGSKMSIPGSQDRFELGVEKKSPIAEGRYHIKDHICLGNSNVPKMTADLRAKPEVAEFPAAIADTHQLPNGKNVVEIYDLDKNRVEVMEPLKAGEKDVATVNNPVLSR